MTAAPRRVLPVHDPSEWDDMIRHASDANVFQSAGWGQHRRTTGWRPLRLVGRDEDGVAISAQVLTRRLPLGIVLAWSPGGPLVGHRAGARADLASWWKGVLAAISAGSVATYVRFDCAHVPDPTVQAAAVAAHLRRPLRRINTGLTTVLRIDRPVELVVGAMRKEHRRELRRAGTAGLRWRAGRDPSLAHELVALQAEMLALKELRARRPPDAAALDDLIRSVAGARVVIGYLGDRPVTGALILSFGDRAVLHTLASAPAARVISASYALIARAVELLASEGVAEFDLGGLRSLDRSRGVDLFKIGFGGDARSRVGEWEWANAPGLRVAVNAAIALRGPAIGE